MMRRFHALARAAAAVLLVSCGNSESTAPVTALGAAPADLTITFYGRVDVSTNSVVAFGGKPIVFTYVVESGAVCNGVWNRQREWTPNGIDWAGSRTVSRTLPKTVERGTRVFTAMCRRSSGASDQRSVRILFVP